MENKIKMLSVDEIQVKSYCLPINKKIIDMIVNKFDINLFGVLIVCERDNQYYLIDGKHRLAVAVTLGLKEIACNVINVKNSDEEMELYVKANTVTRRYSKNIQRKAKNILQCNNAQLGNIL